MITDFETLNQMTFADVVEYVWKLEEEVQELRAKTDNTHKLTPAEVREIRRWSATGLYSNVELASWYGVNPETIRRTISGEYHRDVV